MKHFHYCTIHETTQMDNVIIGTSYWLSLGCFSLKISHLLCSIRTFCKSLSPVCVCSSLKKVSFIWFFVQPFQTFRFQVYSFHLTSSSFDRLCLICSQNVSQAESNPPWTLKLSIFLQLSTLSPASHTLRGVTIITTTTNLIILTRQDELGIFFCRWGYQELSRKSEENK